MEKKTSDVKIPVKLSDSALPLHDSALPLHTYKVKETLSWQVVKTENCLWKTLVRNRTCNSRTRIRLCLCNAKKSCQEYLSSLKLFALLSPLLFLPFYTQSLRGWGICVLSFYFMLIIANCNLFKIII